MKKISKIIFLFIILNIPALVFGETKIIKPKTDIFNKHDKAVRYIMKTNRHVSKKKAKRYVKSIKKYSAKYNLSQYDVLALIEIESTFYEKAISKKNCIGLGQINPFVWIANEGLLVKNNILISANDLYNPEKNIESLCFILNYYSKLGRRKGLTNSFRYAINRYLGIGTGNSHFEMLNIKVYEFNSWRYSK